MNKPFIKPCPRLACSVAFLFPFIHMTTDCNAADKALFPIPPANISAAPPQAQPPPTKRQLAPVSETYMDAPPLTRASQEHAKNIVQGITLKNAALLAPSAGAAPAPKAVVMPRPVASLPESIPVAPLRSDIPNQGNTAAVPPKTTSLSVPESISIDQTQLIPPATVVLPAANAFSTLPWLKKAAPAQQPLISALPQAPVASAASPAQPSSVGGTVTTTPVPQQPLISALPQVPVASAASPAQPSSVGGAVATTPAPALDKDLQNNLKDIVTAKSSDLTSVLIQPMPADSLDGKIANKKQVGGGYSAFKQFLAESKGMVALNVSKYSRPADIMEPITLDEAVAFALKNNLEVKASGSRTKSAAIEKMAAYSRLLPSVDVKYSTGSETSAPSSYNDEFGNRVLNDKHKRNDHSFAVRQPLIDLEVLADIRTSHDKESLAHTQERDDRDGIAYDTVTTYLKLLQARISIQLADQYRDRLEELSQHMQARLEGGGATVGDLERIKAHASSAAVAHSEALGEYESNLAEFRRLTQITPAQLLVSEVLVPEVPDSLTDALNAALRNNPAYIASQNKKDIANATRDGLLAKIAPKLSLEYSDTYSYDAGGAAKGNPVDGAYPTQDDKRLLLVAHWTLNGGLEVAEGMGAHEKAHEATFMALDTRSRLEEGIRASYNAINTANQRVEILQGGIASNEKVVREFEDQYKSGTRSIFELLDAQAQLYNSRVSLMRIEIARALAGYQVRRQMGSLLPALIEQSHAKGKY